MKAKILGDFQICISVPLSSKDKKQCFYLILHWAEFLVLPVRFLHVRVLINFYLLHTKYTKHLMNDLILVVSFLTCLKYSIKCDVILLYSNLSRMIYLATL